MFEAPAAQTTRTEAPPPLDERTVVWLVGAVQFVNVLDFMMVMPLGPDLATALGIPASRIGVLGGSYTAAAAAGGVLGAFVLDRLDRKRALAITLAGLVLATAAGGFAVGLVSMMLARVVAGLFGGPATSIALAIVADVVPPARRGVAMGKVMGAFALASILGVPVGLELARLLSWRAPFFAVAGLGLAIVVVALTRMPSMTGHLGAANVEGPTERFEPSAYVALAMTAFTMVGSFLIIPNLSAYLQYNLGFPRAHLGFLYAAGGAASLVAMRVAGRWVDRESSTRVLVVGSTALVVLIVVGLVDPTPILSVPLFFVAIMVANSFRYVPMNALSSRVPRLAHRARFLSTQSAVQHLGSATGAVLGATMLHEESGHRLVGMTEVGLLAGGLATVAPILCYVVERQVRAREHGELASEVTEAMGTFE